MKTNRSTLALPFSDNEQFVRNRKILRYRSCLAYLSIVCTNIKHLKADLLSNATCERMAVRIKEYIDFRIAMQEEIKRQEALHKNVSERRKKQHWSSPPPGLRRGLQINTARFHFLATVYSYAEALLADIHMLNYEHLSNSIYEVLGQIVLTQMQFRDEIQSERDLQSQRKTSKVVYRAG